MRSLVVGCCACVGGVYAYGNVNSGVDYDGAMPAVHASLASMPEPEGLGDIDVRTVSGDPNWVAWHFEVDGQEIGEVKASLTAQDADTTNVRVEFEPGDAVPKGSSRRAMMMQPMVEQVAETMWAEQVGATLEHRPFNRRAVAMELATYIRDHPQEMRRTMIGLQTMVDEAMVDGGFGFKSDHAAGFIDPRVPRARIDGSARPMVRPKPMTDLSRFR